MPRPGTPPSRRHAVGVSLTFAALSLAVALGTSARAEDHAHHHHHGAANPQPYVRTQASYTLPDVKLVDAEGAAVPLRHTLAEADTPVILNFIFTTCGAICPVMSQTFSQLQDALGAKRNMVRMVSISIDPEHDTPAALRAYADKYGAGPQWQMLTGGLADSVAVQRAFDVYRGDKMNHQPATFLRASSRAPWVRLDGFASADDILRELRGISKN